VVRLEPVASAGACASASRTEMSRGLRPIMRREFWCESLVSRSHRPRPHTSVRSNTSPVNAAVRLWSPSPRARGAFEASALSVLLQETALPKRRTGWDSNPRDACAPAGFQDQSPGDDAAVAQRAENKASVVAPASARDRATPRPLCRNETLSALCSNTRNVLVTSHEQDRSCSAVSDAKRRAF
jgi:hypothetical protein